MFSEAYEEKIEQAKNEEEKGNLDNAIDLYSQVLERFPRQYECLFNLGNLYFKKQAFNEAIQSYIRTLNCNPNFQHAHYNLANTLKKTGDISKAAYHYEICIKLDPNYESAYFNLANLAKDQGKFQTAIRNYETLLKINPDHLSAKNNLISAYLARAEKLFYQNKIMEMEECLKKSLKLDPQNRRIQLNLAVHFLCEENFKTGFEFYQNREDALNTFFFHKHIQAEKIANMTDKKLFLLKEQGIGDQLFFLRFAPFLKKEGFSLSLECDKKLCPLLKKTDLFENIVEDHRSLDEKSFETHKAALIGDLPYICELKTRQQIPPSLKLTIDKQAKITVEKDLDALKGKILVGLTWEAGTLAQENIIVQENELPFHKKIELEPFAKLLKNLAPHCHFILLQKHAKKEDLNFLQNALNAPLHDFSHYHDDLELMLALLDKLGIYIGVANTNLHLRNALNKGMYTLVSFPWDWRWAAKGQGKIWYPQSEFFFQAINQTWPTLRQLQKKVEKDFFEQASQL